MLYLLRNKKTKQLLRVRSEHYEQHSYYEEPYHSARLRISDLGWGTVYATDNIDDITDLLKMGESSDEIKLDSGLGERFESSDLEVVEIEIPATVV